MPVRISLWVMVAESGGDTLPHTEATHVSAIQHYHTVGANPEKEMTEGKLRDLPWGRFLTEAEEGGSRLENFLPPNFCNYLFPTIPCFLPPTPNQSQSLLYSFIQC